MGHPFDAAWSVIVQKGEYERAANNPQALDRKWEYVNPASPLLGEALDRARRARPPHLPNQAASKRAVDNPYGYSPAKRKRLVELGLDPRLSMEHNLKISEMLPDRSPRARGQPMTILGQTVPAGSRAAAKLAQAKHPPSPRYSPTSSTPGRPGSHPLSNTNPSRMTSPTSMLVGDDGPSPEDMLFDMAAPDVYNPQKFPISPMERASMQESFSNMLGKDPMRGKPFRPGDVGDPRYG